MNIYILFFTLLVAVLVGAGLFTGLVLSVKLGFLPKLGVSKGDCLWFVWLCQKAGIVKSL